MLTIRNHPKVEEGQSHPLSHPSFTSGSINVFRLRALANFTCQSGVKVKNFFGGGQADVRVSLTGGTPTDANSYLLSVSEELFIEVNNLNKLDLARLGWSNRYIHWILKNGKRWLKSGLQAFGAGRLRRIPSVTIEQISVDPPPPGGTTNPDITQGGGILTPAGGTIDIFDSGGGAPGATVIAVPPSKGHDIGNGGLIIIVSPGGDIGDVQPKEMMLLTLAAVSGQQDRCLHHYPQEV